MKNARKFLTLVVLMLVLKKTQKRWNKKWIIYSVCENKTNTIVFSNNLFHLPLNHPLFSISDAPFPLGFCWWQTGGTWKGVSQGRPEKGHGGGFSLKKCWLGNSGTLGKFGVKKEKWSKKTSQTEGLWPLVGLNLLPFCNFQDHTTSILKC